jgi:hypothetical protein
MAATKNATTGELSPAPKPETDALRKKAVTLFPLVLSVVLLGATGYLYYQNQKYALSPVAEQVKAQEEAQKLAAAAGKLILLPKDETPTIATVTDVDKLKDQEFFTHAKNGDKVLIYPTSKLALIFDPKANLILNVGPIDFSQPQEQAQQDQKIRVALFNGTGIVGLTYKLELKLKTLVPTIEVVVKDQASHANYERTLVVALTDAAKAAAAEVAKTMNASLDRLPDGETRPADADILIIVGKDST